MTPSSVPLANRVSTALEPVEAFGVRLMSSGFIVAEDQALTGTLTVRGTTRPVTLTVTRCEVSRESFTARATARIDRTEFGITAARGLAARYLDLTVEVQCTRN